MSSRHSELLTKMLSEMQACGLTNLRSDQVRKPPRAEAEKQQAVEQVENGHAICLPDLTT